MADLLARSRRAVDNSSGELAMARLADRLTSLAPPPLDLTTAQIAALPRPSPAVAAALATSRAISARAAERARRSRSIIGVTVDGFVSACSSIPYALVAFALRLTMARLFFLDGQTRVAGPRVALNVQDLLPGFDISAIIPMQVKADTFAAFLAKYPLLPVPPLLGAYLLSYAEFILPIMLVLGFGTRFAALGLLIITGMVQVYFQPQALWTAHIYWAAILLVLLSRGAGALSLDQVVRFLARR